MFSLDSETDSFRHLRVDSGELNPRSNMTPILLPDGEFKKDEIAELFKKHSARLDGQLVNFVYQKLLTF